MKILIDSREQAPYTFQSKRYDGVEMESAALSTGDYSLAGLTDKAAIERKSLPDLIHCLGHDRERFENELARAAALDLFAVIVEASWQDMATGNYRSKFQPHAACQSITAFINRYKTPFLFAGSRSGGEYVTWSLLRQYLETARKRWQAIVKAHGASQ